MTYPPEVLERPFGAESRALLLGQYLKGRAVIRSGSAWEHVYRLLLWIDPTTSLAHCYESDKSQPGRHWYERSLAFHKWVSEKLGVAPRDLHRGIDFLFKGAMKIAAVAMAEEQGRRVERAEKQRGNFGSDLPVPGEDPELTDAVETALRKHYGRTPEPGLAESIIRLVRSSVAQENKRKNLVGEGFEDVLATLLKRTDTAGKLEVSCRKALHEVPGFRQPPRGEKRRMVDLAVVQTETGVRTLATVKWSVRADREEQFEVDYDAYARMEESGEPFRFVFITNEFDAARIAAACKRRHAGRLLFDGVIHMNPQALAVVHGGRSRGAAVELLELMKAGRVSSLAEWIGGVLTT